MEDKHGFIQPHINADEWLFGALPDTILQGNGQWVDYLPVKELQKRRGIETYGCTLYNTLNPVETLISKKYKIRLRY